MARIFTLFHHVNNFDDREYESVPPDFPELLTVDKFLGDLLDPLEYDPGDRMVQAILERAK